MSEHGTDLVIVDGSERALSIPAEVTSITVELERRHGRTPRISEIARGAKSKDTARTYQSAWADFGRLRTVLARLAWGV